MAGTRLQWTMTVAMGNGSSGNGQQQQRNGRRDGGVIAMDDEMAAAQDNCRQCRSGAKGVWYFRLVFFLLSSQLGKLPPGPLTFATLWVFLASYQGFHTK
jgi:hypothetical protein